ncbi:MAG TPA: type 4a pilus biogenesis protein PilO [Polyangiaceae bacterium]|nr:type 4a pilus biogenesis protein PilO [Polyangiaceae bacterium]
MAESALARLPMSARVGVTVGLVVLVGVAYYVAFYSEVAGAIDAAQAARTDLLAQLDAAKKVEAAYQKDLEELARRRERERELNKILPPSTEYPAFLSSVQNIANTSGIELTAWTPQPEVKEDFYARVPMKVELSGRFHQVAKFFYGIGQSDRIMNMENISIRQPRVEDNDVYLSVTGLATAFRSLDQTETTASQARRSNRGG